MKMLQALLANMSTMLFGLAFFSCGTLFLLMIGLQVDLACQRLENGQVDCTRKTSLYGYVPLGEQVVYDLLSASVADMCDSDGCTYRVELMTSSGLVPVMASYSSGTQSKYRLAGEINDFLADSRSRQSDLRFRMLSDTGWVALVPLLFVLVGWGVFLAALVRSYWEARLGS